MIFCFRSNIEIEKVYIRVKVTGPQRVNFRTIFFNSPNHKKSQIDNGPSTRRINTTGEKFISKFVYFNLKYICCKLKVIETKGIVLIMTGQVSETQK